MSHKDRGGSLTQNLLRQGHVDPRLKSSLQNLGRHHSIFRRYGMFQDQDDLFLWTCRVNQKQTVRFLRLEVVIRLNLPFSMKKTLTGLENHSFVYSICLVPSCLSVDFLLLYDLLVFFRFLLFYGNRNFNSPFFFIHPQKNWLPQNAWFCVALMRYTIDRYSVQQNWAWFLSLCCMKQATILPFERFNKEDWFPEVNWYVDQGVILPKIRPLQIFDISCRYSHGYYLVTFFNLLVCFKFVLSL